MLKILKDNTVHIEIGWANNWCKCCDNYWDDVPYRLLAAVDHVNRTGMPKSVQLNADGYDFIIVFNVSETHIIRHYDDNFNLYTVDVSIKDVTRELVADVRRDIVAWSEWGDRSDFEAEERKLDLESWCRVIEKRL